MQSEKKINFLLGKPAYWADIDNTDWVPTKNLRGDATDVTKNLRGDATEVTKNLRGDATEVSIDKDKVRSCNTVSTSTQTNLTSNDIQNLQECCNNYKKQVIDLKEIINISILSKSIFEKDDEKVAYYTGLSNFGTLMIVFDLISDRIYNARSMTKFQMLLLTLMHLRLNLDFKDLAYRFGIANSTASNIFYNCLSALYSVLCGFIHWPDRLTISSNMPMCFKDVFGDRVTAILDCFEIFIQRPANLIAANQCWSNYKHHHTVKVLISITPQGSISYISKSWGGRSSDKLVTEYSNILNLLLPGDLILADRGFRINDVFNLYGAEVIQPAFTNGKNQLNPLAIESTRNLAQVRIHVERVIGNLRQKYRILHSKLPLSLVAKSTKEAKKILDQILIVCSALTNMCPTIVPFE